MGLTSLQVCMDSADWLQVQGTMEDESGIIMDSSSSLSPSSGGGGGGDMMLAAACSRPAAAAMMERRLRPPHDQSLKCPRCESTHTKFCYYNNYSLTQPRYFCKTCRRYWTKGGTLRNIPVGGGCRKSKKSSSGNKNKHSNSSSATSSPSSSSSHHLHHHDLIMNHHNNHQYFNSLLLGSSSGNMAGGGGNIGLMMNNNNNNNNNVMMAEPIDFLESKLEAIVGRNANNYDFMGNGTAAATDIVTNNDHQHQNLGLGGLAGNFHGMMSYGTGEPSDNDNYATAAAAGMSSFMETCQRLMLPYDHDHDHNNNNNNVEIRDDDVKPTTAKLLSLDTWQQDHHQHHEETPTGFGYLNGAWNTNGTVHANSSNAVNRHHLHHHHLVMNGYNGGSSTAAAATTNPLL